MINDLTETSKSWESAVTYVDLIENPVLVKELISNYNAIVLKLGLEVLNYEKYIPRKSDRHKDMDNLKKPRHQPRTAFRSRRRHTPAADHRVNRKLWTEGQTSLDWEKDTKFWTGAPCHPSQNSYNSNFPR